MNFVTVLFFLGLLLTIVASVGLLRLTGEESTAGTAPLAAGTETGC